MTISINQAGNVLKAYAKQNKPLNPAAGKFRSEGTPIDRVTLSFEADNPETIDKMTYSLLDVLLKNRPSDI